MNHKKFLKAYNGILQHPHLEKYMTHSEIEYIIYNTRIISYT